MHTSCPICLDLFDGLDIAATPCGHVFHSKCIYKLNKKSKFCPECRAEVTKKNILEIFFNTTRNETELESTKAELREKEAELESKKAELREKDAELESKKAELREKDAELDSRRADLGEKEAKLAASNKRIEVLQGQVVSYEKLYLFYQHKCYASRVDTVMSELKSEGKLESKIRNLRRENCNLRIEVNQLNKIQTILQGTQHEAEVILQNQSVSLAQEVGGEIAKDVINYCSILKRKLCKVSAEREQSQKKVDKLLYVIGLQNAKLKKLKDSEIKLKKLFKKAEGSSSPMALVTCRNPELLSNSIPNLHATQITPVSTNSANRRMPLASNSAKDRETSEITRITRSSLKRKQLLMKDYVLNKLNEPKMPIVNPISRFPKPVLTPLKRKPDIDEDSIMRVGYNGLGCHERVICEISQEHTNPKPYKENPSVKRLKRFSI